MPTFIFSMQTLGLNELAGSDGINRFQKFSRRIKPLCGAGFRTRFYTNILIVWTNDNNRRT
ncbi:MAG: hypothetical protein J0I84_21040 [Terrimonas sp.]|nr:hypothetical protein [Terrimonas sp.]